MCERICGPLVNQRNYIKQLLLYSPEPHAETLRTWLYGGVTLHFPFPFLNKS